MATISVSEELPPAPTSGAPSCGLPSGDRLLLTLVRQDTSWIDEIKSYLQDQVLPEGDALCDGGAVRRYAWTGGGVRL